MGLSELNLVVGLVPAVASLAVPPRAREPLGVLAELALGDLLFGQVVEEANDGTVLLDLMGERIRAKSELVLRSGSRLHLRVVSLAPEVTLQVVPEDPAESGLLLRASQVLARREDTPSPVVRLAAFVEALRSFLSDEPEQVESSGAPSRPTIEAGRLPEEQPRGVESSAPQAARILREHPSPRESPERGQAASRPPVELPPAEGAAPTRTIVAQKLVVEATVESRAGLAGSPGAEAPASPRDAVSSGGAPSPGQGPPRQPPAHAVSELAQAGLTIPKRLAGNGQARAIAETERRVDMPGSPEANDPAPVRDAARPAPLAAQEAPRPAPDTGLARARVVLQPGEGALAGKAPKLSAEATEAIRTLQRALDESSVNLDNLTPAALQKAIRSLGQPVERKLLNLLDRGGAVALSEVQNDVTAALARIVRGPVARSLPDGLKELAAETLAHVEARQALNALAVADGQLLLQVALRGPGGWELADILVEEEGRREGDDGSDKALHLTLQLHPDALGPLRALVRLRREEVACSLVCSNPEVAEFIGDRLPEFQTGLAKQGFQVRSLQAVAVSSPAEAFGPLRPSRLRPRSLLDALL